MRKEVIQHPYVSHYRTTLWDDWTNQTRLFPLHSDFLYPPINSARNHPLAVEGGWVTNINGKISKSFRKHYSPKQNLIIWLIVWWWRNFGDFGAPSAICASLISHRIFTSLYWKFFFTPTTHMGSVGKFYTAIGRPLRKIFKILHGNLTLKCRFLFEEIRVVL